MNESAQKKRWDVVSFILHFGFGLSIACQLSSSLIMHRPYEGRVIPTYTANAFILHSYIGLVATSFVLAYWIWVFGFRREKIKHLFPWGRSGWKKTKSDFLCMCRLRLPEDNDGGLAGLIHGFGLLLVSAVGILGTTLFFTLPNTKSVPALIGLIAETHAYLAYWIWWYIIGHSLMAVIHGIHSRVRSS